MMMAEDVGSMARILNRCKDEEELVTRDLLGGCGILGTSKELDLDLKAPLGWEKQLDLVSGEVFFRRSNTPADTKPAAVHVQDLNMASPNLDLKLFPPSSFEYQSVCTLDKVKSALERAAKAKSSAYPRRSDGSSSSPTSSSTSATTTSSGAASRTYKKQRSGREEMERESRTAAECSAASGGGGGLVAAGCPSCLSYVLISKSKPRCPRCDSAVSLPVPSKKRPRIDLDLNFSLA